MRRTIVDNIIRISKTGAGHMLCVDSPSIGNVDSVTMLLLFIVHHICLLPFDFMDRPPGMIYDDRKLVQLPSRSG